MKATVLIRNIELQVEYEQTDNEVYVTSVKLGNTDIIELIEANDEIMDEILDEIAKTQMEYEEDEY